jgi:hypothetical protein
VAEMAKITARDEERHTGQYYASARHTIQVDFGVYCADLRQGDRGGREAGAVVRRRLAGSGAGVGILATGGGMRLRS